MNISRFFIDRPVFAAVLSILIVVAGLVGLRALPISEYPDVVPPSIVVRASYPGANPSVNHGSNALLSLSAHLSRLDLASRCA